MAVWGLRASCLRGNQSEARGLALASWAIASRRTLALVRDDLPSGTVTFLFTDIEGSTKLLHELGAEGFAGALAEHRRVLRAAFHAFGGVEVDTQGDAFFVVFPQADAAVSAVGEAQRELAHGPIRVRMGLHTGTPYLGEEGYIGEDVHLGARIAAAGHGGQVLLSEATRRALQPGENVSIADLGEHRLKDFPQAVAIFQLGEDRFPPLKTISNTNLPRPASRFVGRGREVAELVALVRGDARLVTLSGPGGSGKTRLAIEAASELVPEVKAGVFWIALATIQDPSLVVETIAETLGAKGGLAQHIGERELLLVLDNLEQVINAAPELGSLLEACPNLTLLVTSRELLRIRGEVDYPVLPLADPDALELFTTRANVEANEVVAELCHRLDNLPLALELAAARARVLSPTEILDRISQRLDLLKGGRDADPRQKTLRATIEWSHDLLDPDERVLFARLAVFRGGCTLEAAERVVDADLDVLQSLVDKSLLRRSGDRFWMLETIREFASERLEDAEFRLRHAEHYLALAEEAYPHLTGNPKKWLDLLSGEHDNFRAALDVLGDAGETQRALGLAGALYRFWNMRGHFAEGRRWLDTLLALDARPTAARARALNGAAVMALDTGDPAAASERSEEALAIHSALGDEWGAAYSVFSLAMAGAEEADWARALPLFEKSLGRFRELGDAHYALIAADAIAWMLGMLGDLDASRRGHEDVLRDARAQGDWATAALQLDQLAGFASDDGRTADALEMLREAISMKRDLDMPNLIVESLSRFASTLAAGERGNEAAVLLGATQALREEIGGGFAWVVNTNDETLSRLKAQLDAGTLADGLEQGRRLTAAQAIELAQRVT